MEVIKRKKGKNDNLNLCCVVFIHFWMHYYLFKKGTSFLQDHFFRYAFLLDGECIHSAI